MSTLIARLVNERDKSDIGWSRFGTGAIFDASMTTVSQNWLSFVGNLRENVKKSELNIGITKLEGNLFCKRMECVL